MKKIDIGNITLGDNKALLLIAGPCVIENDSSITFDICNELKKITSKLNIPFVYKVSYDKANRTSIEAYRGPGIEKGIQILQKLKQKFDVPILTDVHDISQVKLTSDVADIIQIPAFLSRQTDLIIAAAKTGKIINIKKGQFLSPKQVIMSAQKAVVSGNDKIFITERGFSFGYGNLVVDMRSIPIIQSYGYPVIIDATHSVQLPGGGDTFTSGERQFVKTLALSAVAAGADGIFLEVHPDPDNAPCDGPNMLQIDQVEDLLVKCKQIYGVVRNL